MKHQLALVTAIRKIMSNIDADDGAAEFFTEVINGSEILEIINGILSYKSNEEEMYFLRLEALWILVNLAYVEKREMAVICASETSVSNTISVDRLMNNMNVNKSVLLSNIDSLISEKVHEGFKDIKTLQMIFHFLNNCIATGREFAKKVL